MGPAELADLEREVAWYIATHGVDVTALAYAIRYDPAGLRRWHAAWTEVFGAIAEDPDSPPPEPRRRISSLVLSKVMAELGFGVAYPPDPEPSHDDPTDDWEAPF